MRVFWFDNMILLFGFIYAALAVSLAACTVRAVRYARLPVNLRWELYPIPHEDPMHAGHGGSYFEDLDWWTKPPRRHLLGEWKAMAAEIFLLRAMYEHNRKLWRCSYPFHLGLYILIFTGLAAAAPLPGLAWVGLAGCILVMAGAAGLLIHRISDRKLRLYSAPADYFNLCFFVAAAGGLAFSKLAPNGRSLAAVARALLTFDTGITLPASQAVAMAAAALLIAYIPMTHMAHFIAKYFAYHAIRWSDRPSAGLQGMERRIAEYLTYKPDWSAPHMGANSGASWAEIVAQNPAAEKSK